MESKCDFAAGLFLSLYPQVNGSEAQIEAILAAQQKLETTIEQLATALKETEKLQDSSVIAHAELLSSFSPRIDAVYLKLKRVEQTLGQIR